VAVELPRLPMAANSVYLKVRDRASYAFAVVSVAVAAGDGDFRVAFGGVAHVPWRAERAEDVLRGGGSAEEAADAELAAAEPLRDNAFKVPLARNLLVQALAGVAA